MIWIWKLIIELSKREMKMKMKIKKIESIKLFLWKKIFKINNWREKEIIKGKSFKFIIFLGFLVIFVIVM